MHRATVVSDQQHYNALDSYRFIAATGVALYHFNINFQLGLENIAGGGIKQFALFVDFFFILSGFVIAVNYAHRISGIADYLDFLKRRVARVWPLHMATLLVFFLAGQLVLRYGLAFDKPQYFEARWLPENIFLVHAWGLTPHRTFNGPSWSISAEMFCYLLFPILALLAYRLKLWANALIVVAMCMLITLFRIRAGFEQTSWIDGFHDFGMLRAVPSFFIGIVIARCIEKSPSPFEVHWWQVHVAFAVAMISFFLPIPDAIRITPFVVLVWLAAMAERRSDETMLINPAFKVLGDASYAIYMLHTGLIAAVVILARKTTGLDGIWGWSYAALTLGILIPASILCFRWFENPARKALQSLGKSQRRAFAPAE